MECMESKTIKLVGDSKPLGLLKYVVQKYGMDLDVLQSQCCLQEAGLDFRHKTINVRGSQENIENCVKVIKDIEEELSQVARKRVHDIPECFVCLCGIETEIYRLESCGHPYCIDCAVFQIKTCVQNKDFPLRCSSDTCDKPWSWQDIKNMIDRKTIT